MKNRKVDEIGITKSSGNVFADLGLADSDKLKIRSDLVIEIMRVIREKKLNQVDAARIMKISQPKVSAIMNGKLSNLSEYKLLECLKHLGRDIEIFIRPSAKGSGRLTVTSKTDVSKEIFKRNIDYLSAPKPTGAKIYPYVKKDGNMIKASLQKNGWGKLGTSEVKYA